MGVLQCLYPPLESRLVLRDGSNGGSVMLLSGDKHQCLIDSSQPLHLGLCLLESHLELLSGHLKILELSSGTIT